MEAWRTSLSRQYSMAITEFERALLHCPDDSDRVARDYWTLPEFV